MVQHINVIERLRKHYKRGDRLRMLSVVSRDSNYDSLQSLRFKHRLHSQSSKKGQETNKNNHWKKEKNLCKGLGHVGSSLHYLSLRVSQLVNIWPNIRPGHDHAHTWPNRNGFANISIIFNEAAQSREIFLQHLTVQKVRFTTEHSSYSCWSGWYLLR